jgi:protein required for attachment to host cells
MTIHRNWLVVANAARARVLEETGPPRRSQAGPDPSVGSEHTGLPGRWMHVADLVHPQSRMKGEQLHGDAPGRIEGTGHGLGSAAYLPRTDPRERERDRFAREVAQCLNQGVATGRCAGLTLVASDPFLGLLESHLSTQARKRVLRKVAADYTTLPDDALDERLGAGPASTQRKDAPK